MPTRRKVSAVLALSVGAFGLSLIVGYQARSQAPTPRSGMVRHSFTPFTLSKQVLHAAGTQLPPLVRNETYARRTDGSYVRFYEVTSPTGEMGWAGEIHDIRNGREINLEPFTKSAMTFYYSEQEMYEWLETKESCAADAFVAGQSPWQNRAVDVLQGRDVVQVVQQVNGARLDNWVDPKLDCYPLHENIVFPNGGTQDHTVTDLNEGEPPDSLFEVPSGYVEASPAQVESLYMVKYPGHRVFGEELVKLVDERYYKGRKN